MISLEEVGADDRYLSEVEELYVAAFPPDERRDFCMVNKYLNSAECGFKMLVIVDSDKVFRGFISYWEFPEFRYIEHFAVKSEWRGHGIGAQALKAFASLDGRPIVLEVEPPVDDQTRSRVNFYKRNGFEIYMDFHYLQPPYAIDKNSVEMKLMTNHKCSNQHLSEYAKMLHTSVYNVKDSD